MRKIFISYRREDTRGEAGRIFNDLVKEFGANAVFIDISGIEPGRDFWQVIDEHMASCGVFISIIGRNWLNSRDKYGKIRLYNPLDFVRLETAAALKRNIPVIPILVHRAVMPQAEQLPPDLVNLAFRNAIEITHERWDYDVKVLIKALHKHVGGNKLKPELGILILAIGALIVYIATQIAPGPKHIPSPSPSPTSTGEVRDDPAPTQSHGRRIGGARSSGMQRATPAGEVPN